MRTIAIAAQKGGAGKTTISMNLAVAAHLKGSEVLILDLDPQKSALHWHRNRGADKAPAVMDASEENLKNLKDAAEASGVDLLIIDTAPKSERSILAATQLADIVLIPCQPSKLDRHAIGDTVKTVCLTNKPAFFILNNCIVTSKLVEKTVEALTADYDIPIAPVAFGKRAVFASSLEEDLSVLEFEPKGKAAGEVRALFAFIQKQLKDIS